MKEKYWNKVWSKIFSIVLCLAMVVTAIPMTVHAEDRAVQVIEPSNSAEYINYGGTYNIKGGTYGAKDFAIAIYTTEDVTINLLGDIKAYNITTSFIKLTTSCNLTINANGKTFYTGSSRMLFISKDNTSTVTVNGGTYQNERGTYGLFETEGGTLNLNDVTVNGRNKACSNYAGNWTITGGNFTAKSETAIENAGTMKIDGATVNYTNYLNGAIVNTGDLQVTGTTITSDGHGISVDSSSATTLLSGNMAFESSERKSDIYLKAGAMFTMADDFSANVRVGVEDINTMDNNGHRQITTDGTDAKFLSQITSGTENGKIDYENNHLYMYIHNHEWNYTADGNTITANCTVESRPCEYHDNGLQVSLDVTAKKTYTGKAYNADGTDVTIIGGDTFKKETGATPQIKYTKEDGTSLWDAPSAAGNYIAKLVVDDKSIEKAFTIEPKQLDDLNVRLDGENTYVYTKTGKEIKPYVDVIDPSTGKVIDYTNYDITGDVSATDYGVYTMHIEGKNNCKGSMDITWRIYDKDDPVVKIQDEDGNEWNNTFYEKDTFDILRNSDVNVTIEATDGESGVKEVSYLISDTLYTKEEIQNVADGWKSITNGGTITIKPEKDAIVYIRTVDNSGRVTYVSTDAFTFDTKAPVITGVENKKTYCEAITIHVEDKNLAEVKVNGTVVTLTDGNYELAPSDDLYIIEATDKAGNVTTIEGVKVSKEGHKWVKEADKPATCTEAGYHDKRHCSVCGTVEETEEPALGHSWPSNWTTVKEATATTEGKQEMVCQNGCGIKKVRMIPALSETEDPNVGNLEKDAEVQPDVPLKDVTLGGSKSKLLDLFTEEEKEQIKNGKDARIWLEVAALDESKIDAADKANITSTVEEKIGSDAKLTFFDASLFKKVDDVTTSLKELKDSDGKEVPVEIVFTIPEELKNTDATVERVYQIVRLHNGVVDVIDGTYDEQSGEFSFETDRFSTYAIAYHDTAKNNNGNNGNNNGNNGNNNNNNGNNNGNNSNNNNNNGNNSGNNGNNNGNNNNNNSSSQNGNADGQNQAADVNQNQVSLTTAANNADAANKTTPDTGDSNEGASGFVIVMFLGAALCFVAARRKTYKNL